MNFHKTTVEDFLNKIHHKEIDYSLYLKDLQREILKKNKEHNFLVTLVEPDLELSNKALSGLCYVCKDNFSTKDILSTSSSNFLKNYTPVYDATVIKRLKEAGAQLIGKVALDELAMGGTGMNALTGIVRNAYNSKNMSGGSSSGSVVATALGLVPFALGSDTGDSIRKPAALNGVVGFKGTR
ncbi:MAG: hypothetical protein LBM99_01570 [Bacillales bacterium]|jgi:aspartyl-tRNA(Asn)/glutamyl-tRNA(Gln) amidotransferase subunit A|nr:hypothetical protein [Bacillales bacterium]